MQQVDVDDIPTPTLLAERPSGAIRLANRAALAEWELDPETLASKPLRSVMRPVAPVDDEALEHLLHAGPGSTMCCEVDFSAADEHLRRLHLRGCVLPQESGRFALLIASDVTDERDRNRRLAFDAQRLRALIDANFDAFYDWHIDTDHYEWSRQLDALLGLPVGQSFPPSSAAWADRLHPDEAEAVLAHLRRSIERAESFIDEYWLRLDSGDYRRISDRGFVMLDDAGRVTDLVGVMRDITDERQARVSLEESAALYQTLFKVATNPAIRTDSVGTILDANDAALDVVLIDRDDAPGQAVSDYLGEPARKVLQQLHKIDPSEQQAVIIETLTEVEGEQRALRLSVIPCVMAGSSTYFWLGTDISDLRSATEALLQSEDSLRQQTQALREQTYALRGIVDSERLAHSDALRVLRANLEALVEPMLERLARLVSGRPEAAYVKAVSETLRDLSETGVSGADSPDIGSRPLIGMLTRREQEIARLVRLGKTSDEIAGLLHLSPSTIAFHRKSIRRKLGVTGSGVQLGTLLLRDSGIAAAKSSNSNSNSAILIRDS